MTKILDYQEDGPLCRSLQRGHDPRQLVEAHAQALLETRTDIDRLLGHRGEQRADGKHGLAALLAEADGPDHLFCTRQFKAVGEDDPAVGHDLEILAAERRLLLA